MGTVASELTNYKAYWPLLLCSSPGLDRARVYSQLPAIGRTGYLVLRGCIPQALLGQLNTVLDRHIAEWSASLPASFSEVGGSKIAGPDYAGVTAAGTGVNTATNSTEAGVWEPSTLQEGGKRVLAGDGARWVPEAGLMIDPDWGQPFMDLLALEPLTRVLADILGECCGSVITMSQICRNLW